MQAATRAQGRGGVGEPVAARIGDDALEDLAVVEEEDPGAGGGIRREAGLQPVEIGAGEEVGRRGVAGGGDPRQAVQGGEAVEHDRLRAGADELPDAADGVRRRDPAEQRRLGGGEPRERRADAVVAADVDGHEVAGAEALAAGQERRHLLGQAGQQGRADIAGAGLGAADGVVRHRGIRQAVERLQPVDEVGAVGVAAVHVGKAEGTAGEAHHVAGIGVAVAEHGEPGHALRARALDARERRAGEPRGDQTCPAQPPEILAHPSSPPGPAASWHRFGTRMGQGRTSSVKLRPGGLRRRKRKGPVLWPGGDRNGPLRSPRPGPIRSASAVPGG